jgi:hypothetical protein
VSFIDRLFKRSIAQPKLVGCWHLERPQGEGAEPAEADFRADGRLFYSVWAGDRWQIMKLEYQVDGDMLVTDQPSAPREDKTRFALQADGTLMLEFGGQRSSFKRGPKVAPEP